MSEPLISVVIPTFRRPDLLRRCLAQLAPGAQTYAQDRYEVIVTDDGAANDSTRELVDNEFPWAQWTAGPGRGPAANRNHGAKLARGRWLAFTDDDCIPSAKWLAAFMSACEPHDAATGPRLLEGKTTCDAGLNSPLQQSPVNLIGGALWSCNFAICKQLFESVGGFDECFPYPHLEDADLQRRLAELGYAARFLPDAVVDHPPRPSLPARRLAKQHESWVYHWFKSGRRTLATPRLIYLVLTTRLHTIRERPLGVDSLRALGVLFVELLCVSLRAPSWERRYRRAFTPPAPPDSNP